MENTKNLKELLHMSDEELYCYGTKQTGSMAPQWVHDAENALDDALDVYIGAVSSRSFAEGFRYAMSLVQEPTGSSPL